MSSLNRDWARHELAPEVDVLIEPGSEDYVLVFTVALQLSDDFDTAEWPEDAVSHLQDDLRARVRGAELDGVDWYASFITKASASRP